VLVERVVVLAGDAPAVIRLKEEQVFEHPALGHGLHDAGHVFYSVYIRVQGPPRLDKYRGLYLAEPVTAGNPELHFTHQAGGHHLALCNADEVVRSACLAARARGNDYCRNILFRVRLLSETALHGPEFIYRSELFYCHVSSLYFSSVARAAPKWCLISNR
jgi:hypothetical protein